MSIRFHFVKFLKLLKFVFSGSYEKFSLALLHKTKYIFSP